MAQQAQAPSLNSDPLPETELLPIPLHGIEHALPFAREFIERACEKSGGRWSVDSVEIRLREGTAGLLLIGNETITSAVVVTVAEYPECRGLSVLLAGGKLEDMENHLHELDEIALDAGCSMIEIQGRRGWERLNGFDEDGVILRRDLDV